MSFESCMSAEVQSLPVTILYWGKEKYLATPDRDLPLLVRNTSTKENIHLIIKKTVRGFTIFVEKRRIR